SGYTLAEFYATGLLIGPLFVLAMLNGIGELAPQWLRLTAVSGCAIQLLTQTLKFLWLSRSKVFELRASSLLLAHRLRNLFLARLCLLVLGGIVLPMVAAGKWTWIAAFCLALAGEWLGRYLFSVSVVPKSIAAAFTSGERRAA